MAKDYLNVIERALMMGISDKINTDIDANQNIYVYGHFPATEEVQFPAVIVQLMATGFDEQFFGQSATFGSGGTTGTGEVYGTAYAVHILIDKDTEIAIGSDKYKQRRLLNWMMLNIANYVVDINWDVYEEEELEILDRSLDSWNDIGYLEEFQWYGATAQFTIHFKNHRT
jgi:hypothetical protein